MIRELGITVPVLIDEMDNPLRCTYGPTPNIAYLIGVDGRIVEKQGWYQPQQMEAAIEKYLARTLGHDFAARHFVSKSTLWVVNVVDTQEDLVLPGGQHQTRLYLPLGTMFTVSVPSMV